MKSIQIKSLSLQNFKGIRKMEIKDFQKETAIIGANGTGKTTIFDAFTWLLFGKDSNGRSTFEIKTLDADNNVIEKIDHEVEAVLNVGDQEVTLKRVLSEKWVKHRGSQETHFSGNETGYEWNNVPLKKSDFEKKIAKIIDEDLFKLITSPAAFNTLKWQDQRKVLLDISGGITDSEIAKGNDSFEKLLNGLEGKTLEEFEVEKKATKRKATKEMKGIPDRIDEVKRGMPEDRNFKELRDVMDKAEKGLEELEQERADKSKAAESRNEKKLDLVNEKSTLKSQATEIYNSVKENVNDKKHEAGRDQNKAKSKLTDLKSEKSGLLTRKDAFLQDIENNKNLISELEEKNKQLREEWGEVNAEEFSMPEDETKCPTCKREFEADNIETKRQELKANFQKNKQERLHSINEEGQHRKSQIENHQREINGFQVKADANTKGINAVDEEITSLQSEIENKQQESIDWEGFFEQHLTETDYFDIKEQYKSIAKQIEEFDSGDAQKSYEASGIPQHKKMIDEMKEELQAEKQIEQADKRVSELEEKEVELSKQANKAEGILFQIEEFRREKINRLESDINKHFDFVAFKLFETQVNGQEVETCQPLIEGVPFSDANTASKVNAGLDIINTLNEYRDVSAPIFIDNRESVSELIETKSQVINLIVNPEFSKLIVMEMKQQLSEV